MSSDPDEPTAASEARAAPVQNNKPDVDADRAGAWLRSHYGDAVSNVEPLTGGFWSAAFAFRHDGEALVVRFNHGSDGFEIDQAACSFSRPGLPIPEVLEVGRGMDLSYAISRRHYGQFLETVPAESAPQLEEVIVDLLAQMRAVLPREQVVWYAPDDASSWHDYLLRSIGNEAGRLQDGWHEALARRPDLHTLYQQACTRIHELLPLCPERRDLIHGDLLHQNVLVSESVDQATAVFSWKCSAFGDFLYDLAWCTHWSPWYPGMAATELFARTFDAPDLDDQARQHFAERHHCYELQIAVSHIGWYLWTRDEENLSLLASGLMRRLSQGPRTTG